MLCQLSYAVRLVRECDISELSLVPVRYQCNLVIMIFPVLVLCYMYSGEYDVKLSSEHWASIPKVVGSFPTVARHMFQPCPVWIYTQSNITNIIFT